jgi:hypothetical protein
MYGLRVETGDRWGEVARSFQKTDAEAILLNERPAATWHFLTRARGASKSTDIAGLGLSWLMTDARPLANGHIVAASTNQAAIIIDAAAGFVARTEELEGAIIVESQRIVAPNGAWIRVLAQSDSGSWGLRDAHFLVADEFCQWPDTRGARRVWSALQSAAPKVPNCKLVVMSSAGEPSHWSKEVIDKCSVDKMWRVHEVPGPVPWLSPDELASLRFQLRPSEYDRLVLNLWSEDEDAAIREEDWEAAAQPYTTLDPQKGVKYIILVDIGVVNDATVMTIMHKEPYDPKAPRGPKRVVVDHVERWRGSKKKPVQIDRVVDWIVEASFRYNRAHAHADPQQFVDGVQRLNRRGVRAKEFKFTASSVGEVASALTSTFRNRQIFIPNTRELKEELLALKLKESSPGVTRLDHTRGGHDDQAVTIGMGCYLLITSEGGVGANFREFMERDAAQRLEHRGEEAILDDKARMERRMARRRQGVRSERKRARMICDHRWNPDRTYCVWCQASPEEVAPPVKVG